MKSTNKVSRSIFISIFIIVLALSACAQKSAGVSAEMILAMNEYADLSDEENNPIDSVNVARECAKNPALLFWNEELQGYAVVCPLLIAPSSFGMVMMDKTPRVLNAVGISAPSLSEVDDLLGGWGWELK